MERTVTLIDVRSANSAEKLRLGDVEVAGSGPERID
jgi:hypothetical protein